MMKRLYLLLAIIGAVVPLLLYANFFSTVEANLPLFVEAVLANNASAGIAADALIAAVAFLIWSFVDARALGVPRWWLVPLATVLVGLSLGLPLYLYMRSDRRPEPQLALWEEALRPVDDDRG
jgi:hypothetical protein